VNAPGEAPIENRGYLPRGVLQGETWPHGSCASTISGGSASIGGTETRTTSRLWTTT